MRTTVLIIGGGVTGAGLARDLTLRGVSCVLVDKRDVNAGASGGNHGLLHSGARYVGSDPLAAVECREENTTLKRLAPHCVEDTGGLFVAVSGDDEHYLADFPGLCRKCGIMATPLDVKTAREMEPALSDRLIAAYAVNDASVDPFKLSLDNIGQAVAHGARFLPWTGVVGFRLDKGRIRAVRVREDPSGREYEIAVSLVVNAAGAWAGRVAALAGLAVDLVFSKGTLLVTQSRITDRVVNRLRPATDADILVPGGTVSILGTTSVRIPDPDDCRPSIPEVDRIIDEGAAMVPELNATRYIRAYAGVRPLFGKSSSAGDRAVSRGFALLDHARDGVDNLVTITGGKLTTFRIMAEKTADLVCAKLGVDAPCLTATTPLPPYEGGRWTEPGLAPRQWLTSTDPTDTILCECEMVSKSVVDDIVRTMPDMAPGATLLSIGLRSRIGKGPCQGGLCAIRVTGHLYDTGVFEADQGLAEMRRFLEERWRGVQPILFDFPQMQAEFQEALHCGLFGLELVRNGGNGGNHA
ncbi:FAD-dependent oxidoreductase [Desulfolutivibrio sulfoxidireducens]|uniref:FAD-dependent oxidoreductase n=1 Tax=Desulfolutivibrio sulfoxidireducens TaxID=2773299 RepID=UPI00159D53E3|nr:FAD-dependent oxidoreductase [Desulfolutivibrio sulfoxidireducens]QLA19841.1 FAD-dependent oxidoreductase [Desulfolutivibrio sulfoxidireducens]